MVLATGRGRQLALLTQFFLLINFKENCSCNRQQCAGKVFCQHHADLQLGGEHFPPPLLPRHGKFQAGVQLRGHAHREPQQQQTAEATPTLTGSCRTSRSAPPSPLMDINVSMIIYSSRSSRSCATLLAVPPWTRARPTGRSTATSCSHTMVAAAAVLDRTFLRARDVWMGCALQHTLHGMVHGVDCQHDSFRTTLTRTPFFGTCTVGSKSSGRNT
eukprot:6863091-Prymnesium_polylepis.1